MYHQIIGRFLEVPREHLIIGVGAQLNDISYANVDDSKKALVLLLELFLVKDLDGENTVFTDFKVETLIPVWIQRSLGNLGRLRLLAIYRRYRERVGKSEDISLV